VKTFEYSIRILARWAGITASLSVLLFLSAGTTHVPSLRVYLAAFSAWLLLTMFAVDPGLAKERAHPGAGAVGGATQFVSGLLFLLTLIVAAVDGRRMHCLGGVPAGLRFVALAVFGLSGALQTWAMAVNPFFSTRRALAEGTWSLRDPARSLPLCAASRIPCDGDLDAGQCNRHWLLDCAVACGGFHSRGYSSQALRR